MTDMSIKEGLSMEIEKDNLDNDEFNEKYFIEGTVKTPSGIVVSSSPNNWVAKKCKFGDKKITFPPSKITSHVNQASMLVMELKSVELLHQKTAFAKSLAIECRQLDDALYNLYAEIIMKKNNTPYVLCGNCIRGSINKTEIKKYRRLCNSRLIHTGNHTWITSSDINFALKYYDILLEHDFFGFTLQSKLSFKSCNTCSKANKKVEIHHSR